MHWINSTGELNAVKTTFPGILHAN